MQVKVVIQADIGFCEDLSVTKHFFTCNVLLRKGRQADMMSIYQGRGMEQSIKFKFRHAGVNVIDGQSSAPVWAHENTLVFRIKFAQIV